MQKQQGQKLWRQGEGGTREAATDKEASLTQEASWEEGEFGSGPKPGSSLNV